MHRILPDNTFTDLYVLNVTSHVQDKILGMLAWLPTHSTVAAGMPVTLRPFSSRGAKYFCMKTKFLATISIAGIALLCVNQVQSQPPPSSISTGRTTEQATRPQASGGGHGQVWVNTELGIYHREGSPFYGTTAKGRYMTEQEAIQAGYKRAPKMR